VGTTKLSQTNLGQILGVSKVNRHANYNSATINNDIAILILSSQPTEGDTVMPVCMPSEDHVANEIAYVTGWGTTVEGKYS
jgi:secreted trypsin-like serine protease